MVGQDRSPARRTETGSPKRGPPASAAGEQRDQGKVLALILIMEER